MSVWTEENLNALWVPAILHPFEVDLILKWNDKKGKKMKFSFLGTHSKIIQLKKIPSKLKAKNMIY